MNTAAPACIMSVDADPTTGRVLLVHVCAWCEQANNETPRLGLWCEEVRATGIDQVTHGICADHRAALRSEVDRARRAK